MNDNDPINIMYSQMIDAMGEEELERFNRVEFDTQVDVVGKEFLKAADYYAGIFDPYVVTAALHEAWQDYDQHIMEADDEE